MFSEQELELIATGVAVQIRMEYNNTDQAKRDTLYEQFSAWYDANPEESTQLRDFLCGTVGNDLMLHAFDVVGGKPRFYPKWSQDADLIVKTNQRILYNNDAGSVSDKVTEVLKILSGDVVN